MRRKDSLPALRKTPWDLRPGDQLELFPASARFADHACCVQGAGIMNSERILRASRREKSKPIAEALASSEGILSLALENGNPENRSERLLRICYRPNIIDVFSFAAFSRK